MPKPRAIMAVAAFAAVAIAVAALHPMTAVYWAAFTETPSWDSKLAWTRCIDAIESYPGIAAPPCRAIQMCSNEATLSQSQKLKLVRMAKEAGCEPL